MSSKLKIGDKVKFVNDKDIYTYEEIVNPILGKVYTVRGFTTKGGIYLQEIENKELVWPSENNIVAEPGFATWRFVKDLSQEVKAQNKSKKKVTISIPNEVRESLDLKSINLN